MQGYGFNINSENLAIANWPQFTRNRVGIGPADKVFEKMFEGLKAQANATISPKPLPIKIGVSNMIMNFKDLWSNVE